MDQTYLTEAFKKLSLLEAEEFDITDSASFKEMRDFKDEDELDDTVDIIDTEAETEEEIKDNYIGKVILDCCVCHSKLYKDPEEVVVDSETALCNEDEECPYCYSSDGYKIIGEIAPFKDEKVEEEEEIEVKDDDDKKEVKVKEKEEVKESFKRNRKRGLKESLTSKYMQSREDHVIDKIFDYLRRETMNDEKFANLCLDEFDMTERELALCCNLNPDGSEYEGPFDYDESFKKSRKRGLKEKEHDLDESYNYNEVVKRFKKKMSERPNLESNRSKQELLHDFFDTYELDDDQCIDYLIDSLANLPSDTVYDVVDSLMNRLGTELEDLDDINESLSSDLRKYQTWVDYDMKKYGKISKTTQNKLKKAGLEVIKDDHGDYEVIECDNCNEGCHGENKKSNKKKLKESQHYNNMRTFVISDIDWDTDGEEVEDLPSYVKVKVSDVFKNDITLSTYSDDEIEEKLVDYLSDTYGFLVNSCSIYSSLEEDFEKVYLETKDQIMDMTSDEDGKVTVTTEPKRNRKFDDEEILEPVSDETKEKMKTPEEVEEVSDEENQIDVDVDEFDEESFDELGESYLKKNYDNVDSYKTTSVKENGSKVKIEGVIKFKSGNEKKTSFLFEAKDISKKGKLRLVGENQQLTKGKKAFTLRGKVNEGKFITESFNYSYKAKNPTTGKSIKVCGTVNRK